MSSPTKEEFAEAVDDFQMGSMYRDRDGCPDQDRIIVLRLALLQMFARTQAERVDVEACMKQARAMATIGLTDEEYDEYIIESATHRARTDALRALLTNKARADDPALVALRAQAERGERAIALCEELEERICQHTVESDPIRLKALVVLWPSQFCSVADVMKTVSAMRALCAEKQEKQENQG